MDLKLRGPIPLYGNYLVVFDFNDLYKNETIFILGNGPGLLKVDNFDNLITIGTNCSWLHCPSTIYMTGHMSHLLMHNEYGKSEHCIYQGPYEPLEKRDIVDSYVITDRNIVSDSLPKPITEQTNFSGAENIAFAATHLAYILGASRIVYVGIDCLTPKHFYSDNSYKNRLVQICEELQNKHANKLEIVSDIQDFIECNIEQKGWEGHQISYLESPLHYLSTLKSYHRILQDNNVDVICLDDGICTEAGIPKERAEYVRQFN